MFGIVGDFDDSKAQWAVKTQRGGNIWVKDTSLLLASSMKAKVMFMKKYEVTQLKTEASEQ